MLTLEELQKTNPKIFIGLPCYGGMISENVFHSLLSLQLWGMKNNIHFRTQTMGNESLITRARNTIVSMMLDDTNFVATHLLFVDADIGFQPENIQRLLLADKDVACGIYPRKCIHWEKTIQAMKENPDITEQNLFAKSLGYNLNFDDPQNVQVVDGFCKVQEAATGMMLVKREVFRTMKKKFPERKYNSDQIINGKAFKSDNCYDFFSVGIYGEKRRYLSEDYYFSRLWQECGGEIWADISMPLTHFGNMGFQGHVGSLFELKDKK
jgi:predicted lactoylglutathione lyase